jgi:hypothetical protein
MEGLKLIEQRPAPAEYAELRRLMGWGEIDDETARASVDADIDRIALRLPDHAVLA